MAVEGVELPERSECNTGLGIVDGCRPPASSQELNSMLLVVQTVAEVDGDGVKAIGMHNGEVDVAGFRAGAGSIPCVANLDTKTEALERSVLEIGSRPALDISRK
jgi:hypothetical protein